MARLGGLSPGTSASYVVVGDRDRREGIVRAQRLWEKAEDAAPVTIAIGSCYFLSDDTGVLARDRGFGDGYEIFDAIADKKPDVMLWLGDNVYLRRHEYHDTEAMAAALSQPARVRPAAAPAHGDLAPRDLGRPRLRSQQRRRRRTR